MKLAVTLALAATTLAAAVDGVVTVDNRLTVVKNS